MSKNLLAFFCLLFLYALSAPHAPAQNGPPVLILPGYQHKNEIGIDTHVGRIWKEGGADITYDIGCGAGNRADLRYKSEYDWHKEQEIDGRKVMSAYTKTGYLIVVFTAAEANFVGKVKTNEDVADVLLMGLSFRGARDCNNPDVK